MRPLRVGLTGNIGSGKSTVARLLAGLGAAVIDADALAREAVEDPAVLRSVAAELGDALVSQGVLDRGATGRLVFADEGARRRLNAIVHPWVRRRSAERVAALEGAQAPPPVIVLDIPLLYENGLEHGLDAVVVVTAPLALRVARVAGRSGLEPAAVRERDAAQMPQEEKAARADFVLDNGGTREALERHVAGLWRDLMARRARREDSR